MTDQTTQAAVDATKAPAQPGAAEASARADGDDLDTLLAEFDKGAPAATPATPPQPEPKAGTNDLNAVLTEVRELRTERQQESFRRDMNTTVASVRGNLDPELFDDRLVEAWIDAEARADPRLTQAWNNRHANPKQFQKVVETLGRNFEKKYGKLPDKQATEDREAVSAAVRGASTRAPEGKPPDFSKMTPAEFQAEKDRMFG